MNCASSALVIKTDGLACGGHDNERGHSGMTAFDDKYMTHRRHIAWRGLIIADAIQGALGWGVTRNVKTVLDLGCATGDIVAGFKGHGVHAIGVDNSPAAGGLLDPYNFIRADIRTPPGGWSWTPDYLPGDQLGADLVICLEVLSVVGIADHGPIVRNVARLGRQALLVNHLDPVDAERLVRYDWVPDADATRRLRHLLEPWATKQAMKALYRTGEFWRKRPPESGDSRPESRAAGAPPAGRAPSGNPGDPIFRLAHGMTCENFGVKNPYDRPDGHGNGDGI